MTSITHQSGAFKNMGIVSIKMRDCNGADDEV
jgi:hypothetical protein